MDGASFLDIDAFPDAVLVLETDGTLRAANRGAGEALGLVAEEWVGRSLFELIHPDDVAVVLSSLTTMQNKALGTPVEVRARTAAGEWRLFEVVGANRLDDSAVRGIVVIARDITQRRMWEVAGSDELRFAQVLQHAPAITMLISPGGEIQGMNGAFTRVLGWDPSVAMGRELVDLVAPEAVAALANAFSRASDERRATVEVPLRSSNGRLCPIRLEIASLIDDPVVRGYVVSGTDVSDLHDARLELEYLATHDALTSLPNRALLVERMHQLRVLNTPFALLFVDLDRFKPINDLHGHEAGDQLLRLVAERLRSCVRSSDLVARVGGDEFVLVAPGATVEIAAEMARRVEASIDEPFVLHSGLVTVGASVGVSLSDVGSSVAGLLADADMAMYDVKAARKGEKALPISQPTRRHLAEALPNAIDEGRIEAWLQPIVEIRTGRVAAVEALARWRHPTDGIIGPAAFLELADDAGLGPAVGDMILACACRSLTALPDRSDLALAVNLSVRQLMDPDLPQRVSAIADVYGVPLSRLHIEITEQAVLERRAAPGAVSPDTTLRTLHAMGAKLVLDDFGTGYSSLTHLRRFPLHEIKIDRVFVTDAVQSTEDRAVIKAVIELAHALDLTVVAEGVEDERQLAVLYELGCDLVQGYLLSRPLPPIEAVQWLTSPPLRITG